MISFTIISANSDSLMIWWMMNLKVRHLFVLIYVKILILLYIHKIWLVALVQAVSLVFVTVPIDPDSESAAVDPSTSDVVSSALFINMENAFRSCYSGFYEGDKTILVSRLRSWGQRIRLGECVESRTISGTG